MPIIVNRVVPHSSTRQLIDSVSHSIRAIVLSSPDSRPFFYGLGLVSDSYSDSGLSRSRPPVLPNMVLGLDRVQVYLLCSHVTYYVRRHVCVLTGNIIILEGK